jgi:hypothetical protein
VEQANFMARANPLKMLSSLWWLERPYITLRCTLAPSRRREPVEEVGDEFGLQVADDARASLCR